MSSNIAFRPPGGNSFINRAPGSERNFSNTNNAFMMPATNTIPSGQRSRNNNGELNLAPGADRPYSKQRSSNDLLERSLPNSEPPGFPMHYEQRVFTDLAPGSNRPSAYDQRFLGQRSSNFDGSLVNLFESKICDAYSTGVFASSKCQDYNNSFYDRCVDLQRLRITCDHRIIKFSKDVRNVPDSLCIGSTQTRAMLSHPGVEETYNMTNQMRTKYYPSDQNERKNREKLIDELHQTRNSISCEVNRYSEMNQKMARNILSTENDIKKYFQRIIELLECREKELLNYLEEHDKKQSKALAGKVQNYYQYNFKIIQLADVLMGNQISSNNLEDIKKCNNSLTKEVTRLIEKISGIAPFNPLFIFFKETDINTEHNIAALGELCCKIKVDRVNLISDLCKKGRAILGTPFMIEVSKPSKPFCFGKEVLCRPWGVCCDKNGNIYVGDRSNHRITIFKPNGTLAGEIGSNGTGPGQFNRPAGIAIDLLDRLIIADKDNHRVQILARNGRFITQIGGNGSGSEDGQFNYPWDVAVNMKGDIVVADSRNKRIQLFDLRGNFIGKFCFDNIFPVKKPKTEPTPRSVCFTPTGDILVADFHHLCVVAISQNLDKHYLLKFEKPFSRPQGIACDDFGNIIIADSRDNEIKVFRQTGQHVFSIGKTGSGVGQLDRPNGLCLTPQGRIVCVDFGNNRLEVF